MRLAFTTWRSLQNLVKKVSRPFSLRSMSTASSNMSAESSPRTAVVGLVQMTSTPDKESNFKQAERLIEKAKTRGAQMVFLPECFDYVGESQQQSLELSEPLDGPIITRYRELAARLGLWLSLGGFHERPTNFAEDRRVYNTHLLINSSGNMAGNYSKTHLFNVDIKGGVRLRETDMTIPGKSIGPPIDTPAGKVGLAICYDLRFPELSIALTQQGAEILTYPSAFTVTTGMAHWKVLLQSRAIENQAYVMAAAQVGKHTEKRVSYGHSMIVDPWGTVLAECHDKPDVCIAEVDLDYLTRRRTEMPVANHRRHDLYSYIQTTTASDIFSVDSYPFGQYTVPASAVFYKTALSFAFVNKKPVVPGHALICPLRVVETLAELSPSEVADMFRCAQRVAGVIKEKYGGTATTIAVQDGPDAGQTVKHVHIHVLPRKPGDFSNNDDIYDKLEKHDKDVKAEKWRTDEDMAAEAGTLRPLFV